MPCAETISINDLKRISEKGDRYFFTEDTTRFFGSKYPNWGFKVGSEAFFVTSEQMPMDREERIAHPRTYTVRKMNLETGRVSTVGDYSHTSKDQARAGLKKILSDKSGGECKYDVGL
jgi:hypothetical protein